MGAFDTPWQLRRRPAACYACRARWTLNHTVSAVALEHDLTTILDFPDIWPVLIEPHISYEEYFPAVDEARKRAVDFFAPGSHAGPVAKEALGGVVPLQHVTVSALEFPNHPVVQLRRNNHAIARSVRQLGALCGDAFWNAVPCSVVANRCLVGGRLELGEALHVDRLVVTY